MLLNYTKTGTGPHVVLMHGLFGSLDNLNIIAKALSEYFCVINVDLRNHGQSFHDESMDYPSMAQDIIVLMDHLGIEKSHIIGHSMGGKVAMQIAMLAEQRVNRLVVLDIAPVTYHSRHDEIIKGLNAVAQSTQINKRSDADKLLSNYIAEAGVRQFLLKSLEKNVQNKFNWRFNLPTISKNYTNITTNINETHSCLCDTLFIKGNNSDYIVPEHKEAITRCFINAKAKVIHGAGHWLHAEKPQSVNRSIIDFLQ
ncbi:Esterase YbfF [Pseudoalteromonas holothuriae]|uniref:Esterase YbfF n=1 Tax=Pseudoalteromonas holothuriae TaxID=2963714 RepID=A0A9W4QZV9_9GAMM|nr:MULTISPECIES: alpha/beta fold hydrolase [unclassified Pseudoalteromonas]CAH9060656.1 Esterase YbfF [Pseudoalteromonas sp. CIP111951]CAH9060830.1 Esterase YbfF [Pseudoalteromonas sp. CIP111854]